MERWSPAGLVAETIAESVLEASDFQVVAKFAGDAPEVHLLREGRIYTLTVRDTTDDPLASHPHGDAIRTVARHALADAAEDLGAHGWEDYPDLGEGDWEAVAAELQRLAPPVDGATYSDAYQVLADAAGEE